MFIILLMINDQLHIKTCFNSILNKNMYYTLYVQNNCVKTSIYRIIILLYLKIKHIKVHHVILYIITFFLHFIVRVLIMFIVEHN